MDPKKESAETFEVAEKETGSVATLPTREEAKAQGLTADEMDRAEKKGLVAKPEDVEAKAKADAEAKAKAEKPEAIEAEVIEEKRADGKSRSTVPDFTFKTPEQEKAFLDAFGAGTPQRAMYFRMKNERQARQAAELERDKERKNREELEVRIKALEAGKTKEVDELGEPIDPDDKPLTLKQLRELQKKEAEELEKKNQENNSRAQIVAEAQETQEEYMRGEHEDFDDAVGKTADLIKNLDKLVTEPWKKSEIITMVRQMQVAAAQATNIDLDDNHAARIAYRIAQYHPNYGKKADPAQDDGDASENGDIPPKKANGSLTPEQMKRLEGNTHRRASSASVSGGGGKRAISADDVDAAALDKMTYKDRQKFKEKHPDQYAKLLRG